MSNRIDESEFDAPIKRGPGKAARRGKEDGSPFRIMKRLPGNTESREFAARQFRTSADMCRLIVRNYITNAERQERNRGANVNDNS